MRSARLFENFIQENYTQKLPPLWEVIYQEGIRGHHILFSRSDVMDFENKTVQGPINIPNDFDALITDILRGADLSEMVDMIDAQTQEVRFALFTIYQHALRSWGQHLKQVLN